MGDQSASFHAMAYDSRQVVAETLFVCLRGERTDGHEYAEEALTGGASVLAVNRDRAAELERLERPMVVVRNTRKALPYLASVFYDNPTRSIDLTGVTGTNGKTTVTFCIAAIMKAAGRKTGLIGTIGVQIDSKPVETKWTTSTTPESLDLQRMFDEMRREQVQSAVIEVTSHAIDQERTACLSFDTAVFTNLTQDHLDYHKSMESYRDTKKRLFTEYPRLYAKPGFSAVLNYDDEAGREYARSAEELGIHVLRYGRTSANLDLVAHDICARADGTTFKATYGVEEFDVSLPIGGLFNVYNALAAIGVAKIKGIDVEFIQQGLATMAGVPGRFEPVPSDGLGFNVLVDYAHTPDGIENLLNSARALSPKRVVIVFGCGGDRDRTKRPVMGRIAHDLADVVVVTSDNPRTEAPDAIVDEVLAGIEGGKGNPKVRVLVDRRQAIVHAICSEAKPGDLVLIAGKGHETYQIVGNIPLPFDDRIVAREAISSCS